MKTRRAAREIPELEAPHNNRMEASSSSSAAPDAPPNTTTPAAAVVPSSDRAVSDVMQRGLRDVVLWTAGGIAAGWLAGIVLARGGGGASAASAAPRRALAVFAGGAGFGSAWTQTSMRLEELLSSAVGDETTK